MTAAPHRKIVSADALAQVLRDARAAGKLVVQCHGCFDLVHPGHLRYLQFARQLGHILVVSLTGDTAVAKGPDRPYIPQELRAENLAALEIVDWVVIDPHPTACEILQTLRPDVYVKGREYADRSDPRFARECEIVESYGGRVVFHSGDVVFSSTRLMQDLARDSQLDACRLRAVCARSGIDLSTARRALESLADIPVLVIGDVVLERWVVCDPDDAADDAPVQTVRQLAQRSAWGGAASVARQLRALGARPTLVAAIGTHSDWDGLRTQLYADAVESRLLPVLPELLLRTTYVADDVRLLQVCGGTPAPPDSAAERRAQREVLELLPEMRLLVWCDAGLGTVSPNLRRNTTRRARELGVCTAGHAPGPRGEIARCTQLDLLLTSERYLRRAVQDRTSSLPAVAWNLLHRTGNRAAIVRLHKRGLLTFQIQPQDPATDANHAAPPHNGDPAERHSSPDHPRLRSEFIPTTATTYLDPLGSDENMLAAAALTLAAGQPLALAAYLASAVETITVSRHGLSHASLPELHAWLDARPELRPDSPFLPDATTFSDLAAIAPPLHVQPDAAAIASALCGPRSDR